MTHKYKLTNVSRSPRGRLDATLTEDGSIIATVRRCAPTGPYFPNYEIVKWFSDRARGRFLDFANCLSVSETLEALARKAP